MFKRIVESVGYNVLTGLRLFVDTVFMEVVKKVHTTGKFIKITNLEFIEKSIQKLKFNLKFVYSMRSRDKVKSSFENGHFTCE